MFIIQEQRGKKTSLTKTKGKESIPTYVFRVTDILAGKVLYHKYQSMGKPQYNIV